MLYTFKNGTTIDMSKLFSIGIINTEWQKSNPQFSENELYLLKMSFEVCTESHFFNISNNILFDELTIEGKNIKTDPDLRVKLNAGQLKKIQTDQYIAFEQERNDLLEAWQKFKSL